MAQRMKIDINFSEKETALYKHIVRHCSKSNLSLSEFGKMAIQESLDNPEREWQTLFKAMGRLSGRMEKLESRVMSNFEFSCLLAQILFMVLPRDYSQEEMIEVDQRTKKSMHNLMRQFKKIILEGGIYSPQLDKINLEEDI